MVYFMSQFVLLCLTKYVYKNTSIDSKMDYFMQIYDCFHIFISCQIGNQSVGTNKRIGSIL